MEARKGADDRWGEMKETIRMKPPLIGQSALFRLFYSSRGRAFSLRCGHQVTPENELVKALLDFTQ